MTQKIPVSTRLRQQKFSSDDFSTIEKAGAISLSDAQKDVLQQAYLRYQHDVQVYRAAVPVSSVKPQLADLVKRLDAAREAISQLRDAASIAEAAHLVIKVHGKLSENTYFDDSRLDALIGELETLGGVTRHSLSNLPKELRGRSADPGIGELMDIASRVFKLAGGRKKKNLAFREAVGAAVGYSVLASEGFKRLPDKARRRKGRK